MLGLKNPLYEPIAPLMARFDGMVLPPSVEELNGRLEPIGVRFVPQTKCPDEFPDWYEPRIFLRGEVLTRQGSWHDFFNAISWARFPRTKRVINRLQFESQKSHYPSKQRLPVENMLALFDENGAIIFARDPHILDLIRNHEWHELFWRRREVFRNQVRVVVFGHGLYEKAMQPYVGLTAPSLLFCTKEVESVDDFVCRFFEEKGHSLNTKDLHPFPILGVPGWWDGNNEEPFYMNTSYFRKKK